MSHFTVMVIGENPEDQLAPYDENITTVPVDLGEVSENEKLEMIKFYEKKENGKHIYPFEKLYELKGEDWNGNTWKKQKNGKYHKFTTYNPNSKWDWYQLGGRWADFLKLKEGSSGEFGSPSLLMENFTRTTGYADAALKKDIDIEGMKNEEGMRAGKLYDKARKIIDNTPDHETWENIRKKHTNNDSDMSKIDLAREEYRLQPRIIEWNKSNDFGFFSSPDDFLMSREQYVENARNKAISTFAVIKDGIWYEKGEMGWWGIRTNEKDDDEWNKQINELLESIPDDTLISIYDCHI